MQSSEERKKLIHDFLSFTGTTDENRALSFLDTADWKLSEAVQLFYAQQTTAESVNEGAGSSVPSEEVRAPLPSRYERLVDRSAPYEHLLQRKAKQTPVYEAFRNHTAELAEYEHGPDAEGGTKGLAKLYKAPIEILYRGGFDDAKDEALKGNIWLMVNVQSANEFASHQLNRDTFSNNALKEMIKANFVFLQTYFDGFTGQKLMSYYRLEDFPCILIIDPVTGELMRCFTGFVEADRLIEDLVDYMECGPTDGSASRLLRRTRRGNDVVAKAESIDANNPDTSVEDSSKRKAGEEEAFVASDDGSFGVEEEEEDSRQVRQKRAEVSAKMGQVRVQPVASPQPEAPGENTCTVCILLPNGVRLQRLFYRHDVVESLYGFCSVELKEAQSRSFRLKPRLPGSQFLDNFSATLESAQVVDCLLTFVWDD